LVDAYASTEKTIASATWETVELDTEVDDDRSELDTTNYQFVPDKTGYYLIVGQASFFNVTDGDVELCRLYDTTAGDNIAFSRNTNAGGGNDSAPVMAVRKLQAGNVHELQARNNNSSCDLSAGQPNSFLTIRSVFR